MRIHNLEELEEQLSRPVEADASAMAALKGDLLILGVGGKMGPTLARMAKRGSVVVPVGITVPKSFRLARLLMFSLPLYVPKYMVARRERASTQPARLRAVSGGVDAQGLHPLPEALV